MATRSACYGPSPSHSAEVSPHAHIRLSPISLAGTAFASAEVQWISTHGTTATSEIPATAIGRSATATTTMSGYRSAEDPAPYRSIMTVVSTTTSDTRHTVAQITGTAKMRAGRSAIVTLGTVVQIRARGSREA
jgi:hypothetical protein